MEHEVAQKLVIGMDQLGVVDGSELGAAEDNHTLNKSQSARRMAWMLAVRSMMLLALKMGCVNLVKQMIPKTGCNLASNS